MVGLGLYPSSDFRRIARESLRSAKSGAGLRPAPWRCGGRFPRPWIPACAGMTVGWGICPHMNNGGMGVFASAEMTVAWLRPGEGMKPPFFMGMTVGGDSLLIRMNLILSGEPKFSVALVCLDSARGRAIIYVPPAEVAQVVEHGTENAGVDSSSLSLGTTFGSSRSFLLQAPNISPPVPCFVDPLPAWVFPCQTQSQ